MRHIFIVDPTVGKARHSRKMLAGIEEYATREELDYEIYIINDRKSMDGYIKSYAKTGDNIRFYACGGDGTLTDVVNSAREFSNVEFAAIPVGGNDFIRIFGTQEQFMDIDAQVNGTPTRVDLIKYNNKYAVNQCSMGFDAEVCAKQMHFKKLPFLTLSSAYTVSLVYSFFKMVNHDFIISIDDDPPLKKHVLFCVVANSRWYGRGYKCAPYAMPDDGLLDVIIIEKGKSRIQMFKLLNKYKSGEHLNYDLTTFKRAKKVTVRSGKPAAVNIDGVAEYVTKARFEVENAAIKFVIPSNSTYLTDRETGKISQTK